MPSDAGGGLKLDDSAFQRGCNGVCSVAGLKLCEDIRDMALHGLFGNGKFPCDQFVPIAGRDEPEDVDLARRQVVLLGVFSQLGRDLRWNPPLPGVNRADDLRQFFTDPGF